MALIRRQKLLDREVNRRDARLFIIATEDEETEPKYFETFTSPRVKVEVLASQGGRSSPEFVLQRLAEMTRRYALDAADELWLVLDVDQRQTRTLAQVCAAARRESFQVAISNPCFEVWLCRHFPACTEEEIALAATGRNAGDKLKRLWRRYLPPSATQIERTHLRSQARVACRRARESDDGDISAEHPWPVAPGTRVYELVENLLAALDE